MVLALLGVIKADQQQQQGGEARANACGAVMSMCGKVTTTIFIMFTCVFNLFYYFNKARCLTHMGDQQFQFSLHVLV